MRLATPHLRCWLLAIITDVPCNFEINPSHLSGAKFATGPRTPQEHHSPLLQPFD